MKWRYLLYTMIVGIGFTACSEDNAMLQSKESNEKAIVHINLQQDGQVIDANTRSTSPMPLEDANKMYDLWLLHYNKEGSLIDTQYNGRINSAGELEVNWSPTLTAGEGTLCLVANLGSTPKEWPIFLADLQKTDFIDLPINGTGLYTNKMYMFGYYEGKISNGMTLNILMGRMAACINIVITSTYTNEHKISTNLNNAVTNTHYFPMEEGNNGSGLKYQNFQDLDAGTVSNSKSLTLYYYTGENIHPNEGNRTSIVITAKRTGSNTTKKYTINLSSDAPGTANRNYSLYRNNNYTFNITLKN